MHAPTGFAYTALPDGSVRITHHGKPATTLRGRRAQDFLAEVDDPQLAMARWTGNDKRGNERTAKKHPRNRTRWRFPTWCLVYGTLGWGDGSVHSGDRGYG